MERDRRELELGPNGGTRKRGNNAEVKIYAIFVAYIKFENQWWVGVTGASEASGCFR